MSRVRLVVSKEQWEALTAMTSAFPIGAAMGIGEAEAKRIHQNCVVGRWPEED